MKGKGQFLPLTWLKIFYFLNLAETVLRVLPISRVLELQIRRGWTRWKANTPRYNFYEGTLPELYIFQVQMSLRNKETKLPCFEKKRISNSFSILGFSSAATMFSLY